MSFVRMSRVTIMFVLAALVCALMPTFAHAEEGAPELTSADAPLASLAESTIEVQLWPEGEQGYNLVIVAVELPEDVPLPATVHLPLPEGATVQWAGEITGNGPEGDVSRQFEIVEGVDGSSVAITLEETRAAQYEAVSTPIQIDGERIVSVFDWIQTEVSEAVVFSVVIAPNAKEVKLDPEAFAEPQSNSLGETLHTLKAVALEPGDTHRIKVSYQREGLGGGTPARNPILIPVLLGMVAVVLVLLIVVIIRQKKMPHTGDNE